MDKKQEGKRSYEVRAIQQGSLVKLRNQEPHRATCASHRILRALWQFWPSEPRYRPHKGSQNHGSNDVHSCMGTDIHVSRVPALGS